MRDKNWRVVVSDHPMLKDRVLSYHKHRVMAWMTALFYIWAYPKSAAVVQSRHVLPKARIVK